jgi:uncharacterized protein YcgI (DUF1989 family)
MELTHWAGTGESVMECAPEAAKQYFQAFARTDLVAFEEVQAPPAANKKAKKESAKKDATEEAHTNEELAGQTRHSSLGCQGQW